MYARETGTFSLKTTYFTLCYANEIIRNLYFGINATFRNDIIDKYVYSDDPAFDFATYYAIFMTNDLIDYLKFGFLVREINQASDPDYTIINENKFNLGEQYMITNISASYYEHFPGDANLAFAIGLEYTLRMIQLRMGYMLTSPYNTTGVSENRFLSFGFGLKISLLQIDYGYGKYLKYDLIDPIHKITIGVNLN